MKALAAAGLALLLGACAVAPERETSPAPQAWAAHRMQLQALREFNLQARVATGLLGPGGTLSWRQHALEFSARVAGPFGVGAVQLSGTPERVNVQSKDVAFVTADPETTLRQQFGWTLPVANLRYWVLGLPSGGDAARYTFDADGHLRTLIQNGWTLHYEDYQRVDGLSLPRRFSLDNGEQNFRIIADRWSGLARSGA